MVILADGMYRIVAQASCPGRQTVGRAELAALVGTSRCTGSCHLVSDSRYVCNGAASWLSQGVAQLLHGPDADLWALLVKRVQVT